MDRETASFVVVRFQPGADRKRVLTALEARFPDVDVHDARAFARAAGTYWMVQTGAGGAIGLGISWAICSAVPVFGITEFVGDPVLSPRLAALTASVLGLVGGVREDVPATATVEVSA